MRLNLTCLCLLLTLPIAAQQKPWPIRAVIITTFEIDADTGDFPGEYQLWVEREHLDQPLDFPGGPVVPPSQRPLRTNKDHTVLGMLSGTTLVNATASLMALGMDPRFDLTHAYFLINGIAGVDPADASVGSAAWATFVLNDVGRYIDPRDAPADWPYGIFPIGTNHPNPDTVPAAAWQRSNLYELNASLTNWAFEQTRNVDLGDDPAVAEFRKRYTSSPNAQRPPFVLKGDSFASDLFWHGPTMTKYANDWVRLYTGGRGNFVMTQMEDSGFMNAIERLAAMHRVDPQRVLVLRTGSNFCTPAPGHTAIESVSGPYIGIRLAVESAWRTGSPVLHALVNNWQTTRTTIPGTK